MKSFIKVSRVGTSCCTRSLGFMPLQLKQRHLVALRPALTPAKQRVSLGASVATQQHVETILGPESVDFRKRSSHKPTKAPLSAVTNE